VVYSLNFVYNTKILCKINQAAKQASKPGGFGRAGRASKLEVSKIASQQAEGPQLGLLVTNSAPLNINDGLIYALLTAPLISMPLLCLTLAKFLSAHAEDRHTPSAELELAKAKLVRSSVLSTAKRALKQSFKQVYRY